MIRINKRYILRCLLLILVIIASYSCIHSSFFKVDANSNNTDPLITVNEETRIIIELNQKAAIDLVNNVSNIDELKKQEQIVFSKQKSLIKEVEKITGNVVENKTALLLNTIVIYATKNEIEKIRELPQVKEIQESITYEANDSKDKINYTLDTYSEVLKLREETMGLTDVREDVTRGYKGDGTIVAIIDSGVNYKHIDMTLDDEVRTKYSNIEWENRIDMLGYGKFLSKKVPFGYNYVENSDNVLDSNNTHGYHVAGIVSSNNNLLGVAPNSQIVALKFMGDNGEGTTDYLVKAIEDALILGVDVINMSIGSPNGIVSEDSFQEKAISKAADKGILCCVAAGNIATTDGLYDFSNKFKLTDTATINTPAVAKNTLAIASANVFMYRKNITTEMSKFSSWGPTNELTIKPEITAPGENIFSTLEGSDGYSTQSGTSMAAPYVSGMATLVLNEIINKDIHSFYDKDKSLEGKELYLYIKNTLMNTATPIIENEYHNKAYNLPYSVRLQGAGLANVYSAIKNRVIATYDNEAKIELGEVNETTTFDITLTNYGEKDITYALDKSEIYQPLTTQDGKYYTDKSSFANIIAADSITVPAFGQAKVSCTLKIMDGYLENSFVESYIRFNSNTEDIPNLSLPLLAFYGDWNKEPIIDKSIYDGEIGYLKEKNVINMLSRKPLISNTCLLSNKKKFIDNKEVISEEILGLSAANVLDYDGSVVAFSPNNDNNMDEIYAGITQIRNAYEIKVSILNEQKENIRIIGTVNNIGGSTYLSLCKFPYTRLKYNEENKSSMAWDGKVYDGIKEQYIQVDDGQYYLQIDSKLSKNADIQRIIMPIKVDTEKPIVENSYLDDNGRYKFKVSDNVAMDNSVYLFNEDNIYKYDLNKLDIDDNGFKYIELEKCTGSNSYVLFYDVAGNECINKIHK